MNFQVFLELCNNIDAADDDNAVLLNQWLQEKSGRDENFVGSIDSALSLPLPENFQFWFSSYIPTGFNVVVLHEGAPVGGNGERYHELFAVAICKAWGTYYFLLAGG